MERNDPKLLENMIAEAGLRRHPITPEILDHKGNTLFVLSDGVRYSTAPLGQDFYKYATVMSPEYVASDLLLEAGKKIAKNHGFEHRTHVTYHGDNHNRVQHFISDSKSEKINDTVDTIKRMQKANEDMRTTIRNHEGLIERLLPERYKI
ncbi:MAG: hypothetical protein ACMXYL_03460 [Candidatus Woesearchaeota archaeon]